MMESSVDNYLRFFRSLADPASIYGVFREAVPERTPEVARVVGGLWYHLSEHIVDVLCVALAKLSSPRIRHIVIQTAYEELGEADPEQLHTDLLLQTLLSANVSELDVLALSGHAGIRGLLDDSIARLHDCSSDAEITGALLGMELVAFENIDLVVDCLCYNASVSALVRESRWTRLHHVLEEEHIRRAVRVFTEFVQTPEDQRAFVRTFAATMEFWAAFWAEIAAEARQELGRPQLKSAK